MPEGFIPQHGGYESLLAYQKVLVMYDATLHFCDRFIDKKSRTHDQMVQAARSGKQNILAMCYLDLPEPPQPMPSGWAELLYLYEWR